MRCASSPKTSATIALLNPTTPRKPRRSSDASALARAYAAAETSKSPSTPAPCISSTHTRVSESTTINRRKEPHREKPLGTRRRDHGARSGDGRDCRGLERSPERSGGHAQDERLEREHQGHDHVRRHLDLLVGAEAVPERDRCLQQDLSECESQLP